MIRIPVSVICLVVLPACMIGCGRTDPNRGAIEGAVTLDGKPLENGSIQFEPMEGTTRVVVGGPIERGQYRLSGKNGPTVGLNRVAIRAARKTGKTIPKPMAPPGETVEEWVESVAHKFNTDSTLTFDVKPGDNTADFAVESK